MQASVVMVKPAGTGMPKRVISCRLAPLPPRRFFCSARPSAFLLPKKYTHFFTVAIESSDVPLPCDFRKVRDPREQVPHRLEEREPILCQPLIRSDDQHLLEEHVHHRLERRNAP